MTSKNETHLFHCPCCEAKTIEELGAYEICDTCNWENDPVQSSDPDYADGANHISLNEARKTWATGGGEVILIGFDKFNGNQATSIMTIMTDQFGNLVTAFPGVLK